MAPLVKMQFFTAVSFLSSPSDLQERRQYPWMGLPIGNSVPNCVWFASTMATLEPPRLCFEHTYRCRHGYELRFSRLHLEELCRNNQSKTVIRRKRTKIRYYLSTQWLICYWGFWKVSESKQVLNFWWFYMLKMLKRFGNSIL